MLLHTSVLNYTNRFGQLVEVRGCSLTDREKLRLYFYELYEFVDGFYRNNPPYPYAQLYDISSEFREQCHRILHLCAIALDSLTIDVLIQMLFPHQHGLELRPAYLYHFNYLDLPNASAQVLDFLAQRYSFIDVDRLSSQIPYADLVAIASASVSTDLGSGVASTLPDRDDVSTDDALLAVLEQVQQDMSSGVFLG